MCILERGKVNGIGWETWIYGYIRKGCEGVKRLNVLRSNTIIILICGMLGGTQKAVYRVVRQMFGELIL